MTKYLTVDVLLVTCISRLMSALRSLQWLLDCPFVAKAPRLRNAFEAASFETCTVSNLKAVCISKPCLRLLLAATSVDILHLSTGTYYTNMYLP